MIIILD